MRPLHGFRRRARAAALTTPVWPSAALADYEAGQRAWDAGEPVEALGQWRWGCDDVRRRSMLPRKSSSGRIRTGVMTGDVANRADTSRHPRPSASVTASLTRHACRAPRL